MINRAIYDQLIKKEIVFVEDISTSYKEAFYLDSKTTIQDWYALNEQSQHSRFPAIDDRRRVIGMVTSKDVIGQGDHVRIEKVMTKKRLVVQGKTALDSVTQWVGWA